MEPILRSKFKINIKSLAYESKEIKKEEKKHSGLTRNTLHYHRVTNVRQESRITLLAYGFCKGIPYKNIENSTRNPLTSDMLHRLYLKITRKGVLIEKEDIKIWFNG